MSRINLGPEVMAGASLLDSDGSSLVFEELALPLLDSVYNFAYWLLRNQADAEDLVQETYLKAFRGFASFRPNTNFRAWILRILKNTFLTSRSKAQRCATVPLGSDDEGLPELLATSDTAESTLVDRSHLNAVRHAIEQLPVIFREVILLCDVEEATYREISEALSIPIGTVMSRLARARQSVRESIRGVSGSLPRQPSTPLGSGLRKSSVSC